MLSYSDKPISQKLSTLPITWTITLVLEQHHCGWSDQDMEAGKFSHLALHHKISATDWLIKAIIHPSSDLDVLLPA
jgi:hypothetical protein